MNDPSPELSPELLQEQAAKANAVIAGAMPVMAAAPNLTVDLPVGYEGHRQATVRELNGEDEEALSSYDTNAQEGDDRYSFLLSRALVSVGPVLAAEDPHLVTNLTTGDRNAIFLGIIRATYGDERQFQVRCSNPDCNARLDVTIDLATEFPMVTAAEVGVKDDGTLEVGMRDGSTVVMRLPTSAIFREVRELMGKEIDASVFNTQMLARCVLRVVGAPVGSIGARISEQPTSGKVHWARNLGMADRNKIIRRLTVDQPGPRMEEVKVPCESCHETLSVAMDWALLLYA